MATPVQPTVYKGSDGSALTSGGSFNNRDFWEFGLQVQALNTEDMPTVKTRRLPKSGQHGQFIFPEHYDSRQLVLTGRMVANTPADLLTNIEALKTFLDSYREDTPRRIRLVDPNRSDRWFLCYYNGPATFIPVSDRGIARAADVTLFLTADPPFGYSTELTNETYTPAADHFQALVTGTAPSDPRYIFKGPATNPKIIVGDSIFIADFNLDTDFIDIEGTWTASGFTGSPAQEAALFQPSAFGLGFSFLATGAYQMPYSVKGSKTAGTWFMVLEPTFAHSAVSGRVVLHHRADDDNYLQVGYVNVPPIENIANRRWFVHRVAGGETVGLVRSQLQNFVSGDQVRIAVSYGAAGLKLYVNGTLEASLPDATAFATTPGTMTPHTSGSNFSSSCRIHYMAGWSSQLTDNEIALVDSDPEENIRNRNHVLEYTGTLDTGDFLEFDRSEDRYIGKLFDVSDGSVDEVFPDDGAVIPPLPQENTSIYHPVSAGGFTVQYREAFL